MADSSGRTVMVQGRAVWISGDVFKGRPKVDFHTKQPKINAQGQQMVEYGFGLAVPKSVLQQTGPGQPGEIWAAIHEEAAVIYPSRQFPPGFAFKYKDGDTDRDDQGVPYSAREGYAGCLVFACTTHQPIKFFRFENGANVLISDGIKCGDYLNVQLVVKAHGPVGQGKPGMYLNPNAVQFMGWGKEIISAPSGDQIFGMQAPPLPQGASATPLAPTAGLLVPQNAPPGYPPAQGFQAPQQAPPAFAPQQQLSPYGAQAAPIQQAPAAHYGVLPPAHQPQAPQQYAPPPQQGFAPPAQQQYAPPAAQGMPQPGAMPAMPQAPQYGQPPQQPQYAQQPAGMPPMPGYGQR